jgi:hypothetical protein
VKGPRGPLQCLATAAIDKEGAPVTGDTCTGPCTADADCTRNPWTLAGYCGEGLCVQQIRNGWVCTRDAQCQSRKCAPSLRPGEFDRNLRRCAQ